MPAERLPVCLESAMRPTARRAAPFPGYDAAHEVPYRLDQAPVVVAQRSGQGLHDGRVGACAAGGVELSQQGTGHTVDVLGGLGTDPRECLRGGRRIEGMRSGRRFYLRVQGGEVRLLEG